jgi:hypothetical protein
LKGWQRRREAGWNVADVGGDVEARTHDGSDDPWSVAGVWGCWVWAKGDGEFQI